MQKELQVIKQLIDLSIKKGVFENIESALVVYQALENLKKIMDERTGNNNNL